MESGFPSIQIIANVSGKLETSSYYDGWKAGKEIKRLKTQRSTISVDVFSMTKQRTFHVGSWQRQKASRAAQEKAGGVAGGFLSGAF